VPYRIDFRDATGHAIERLIDLGALDVVSSDGHQVSALMPDRITLQQLVRDLGIVDIAVSPAYGRDADSVWVLEPRPLTVGRLRIIPAEARPEPGALRLIDAPAFGTGLLPTTALCIEALDEIIAVSSPDAVLDVGTGSGVLALGALILGVPRAHAIDVDDDALRVARENARINGLEERIELCRGGPETITGSWSLVLANVLAAPLIEMAPMLVRRVGHHGRLVLSGIPEGVHGQVEDAYRRLGMRRIETKSRGGWVALVMQTSW
jgi:ribosomal protein L11 methyltransferase